jgi:hypothetical protein
LFLDRLSLRNLSPKTVENYMQVLVKASRFYNKSPLKMDGLEIEQLYTLQLYLVIKTYFVQAVFCSFHL